MLKSDQELTDFFWGRELPEEFMYLAHKSPHRLSGEDRYYLNQLKNIILKFEELNLPLSWGQKKVE